MRAGGLLVVAAALVLTAPIARAESQAVRLADGDSFSLGRERYRLYGIDAPELHQDCTDPAGRTWPCGIRARTELRRIIGTHPVQCRTVSTDRFGRSIAVCHAGGRDIAEEMVRAGFATTIERRGSSNAYVTAQAEARDDKRGIWAGRFDMPGEWRRANPRGDDRAPPSPPSPRDWLARKGAELWQIVSDWVTQTFGR
jgi:endonuclease YncB( thermonuclease family)